MLSHCHCLQSFVRAACVCCTCVNLIFSFHESRLLLKGHMWQSLTIGIESVSCLWLWDCSLSLLQPWKGGVRPPPHWVTSHGPISYLGPDMFNRVHICFLAHWVVNLFYFLYIFSFAQKWHKFQVTEKHFDICFEREVLRQWNLWFYSECFVQCLIPLFAVLCSEKMERSLMYLEMTEKAV